MELLTSGAECSSVLLTSDCPTAWQSKMCFIVRRVRWLRPLLVLCLLLHACECKLTQLRPLSDRNMKIQVFWDKTPWRFGGAFCLFFPRRRVDPEDRISSETLVTTYQSARLRVLGHLNLHQYFHKNLRSWSKTSCKLFVATVGGVFVCVVSMLSHLIQVFWY